MVWVIPEKLKKRVSYARFSLRLSSASINVKRVILLMLVIRGVRSNDQTEDMPWITAINEGL
jgi:hypothetical protein